ncbi:MAG: hypothetical protein VXU48_01545 [Verrucomicrobiota bacterium]|nr:hypothetical protein [Verrucomicrobiota bacterium]
MNRPKKNKTDNPILPEQSKDMVDERNLVHVEDSAEISIEDRISTYWLENKSIVSGSVMLLLLLVIGFNGARIYKSYEEEKVQISYSEAKKSKTLENFAQSNSGVYLGGLAALTIADESYSEEDYENALKFYSIASEALTDNILQGRALIGQAFCLYNNGNINEALDQLAAIAANTSLAEVAQVEAAYHLAVEAKGAGHDKQYDRYATQIKASSIASQWQQRLSIFD